MNVLLLICRLLASAVFAVSGVAKLTDRKGTKQALLDFGVPASLAGIATLLLPLAELATSVAFVWDETAWWGAVAAVSLLTIFTAAIAANLLRGRTPDCHCFGQIAPQPVSAKTVVRNCVLAIPALFVMIAGRNDVGLSTLAWTRSATRLELSLAAVCAALAIGLLVLFVALRRMLALHRELADSVHVMERLFDARDAGTHRHAEHAPQTAPTGGLPIGAVAPDFALASSRGTGLTLTALLHRRKPIIAFFGSPTCGPCKEILPETAQWAAQLDGRYEVVAFLKGTAEENAIVVKKYPSLEFVFLAGTPLDEAYRAPWTPGVVVISEEGHIASETAFGVDAIRALIETLRANDPSTTTSSVTTLPEFQAIAPDGHEIDNTDLLGEQSLAVLFWSPTCPYCVALVDDLERWADDPPPRAPRLVLVRSGSAEMPPQQFGAPVVLDADNSVSRTLGSVGTPSAVLVNRSGAVVSPVLVGGPDVRALLGIGSRLTTNETSG